MKKPLSLIIGLRYTRAKRRNHFISFISLASLLGIALGVMVLITVLSVMNGFDQQIRDKFFAITPAVTVVTQQNIEKTWGNIINVANTLPDVAEAAPYVSGNGMIMQGTQFAGVTLMGVLPSREARVSQLAKHMVRGNLNSLQSGRFHVVIGRSLALSLGLTVGDKINVLTPQTNVTLVGVFPRYKTFRVTGIYHTTGGLYDAGELFINMHDAEKLFLSGQRNSGIHIRLHNLYQASTVTQQLQSMLSPNYAITNWTIQFGAFFQALAMEKTMLFVILLLIVAVAAFNLVSTLVMVVNDKRADIAILRTLGARPKTIMMTFIVQGIVIGLMGTVLGLLGGLALASHVTSIANWLQQVFHVQFVRSDVYFINFVPSKIELKDVLSVCLATIGFSFIATIYPAIIAYRTQPAEALRYE
ncbi:MAG: lipoprotein-releasing system transmembrane subunit LolC [Gammaproteobacteria bacterium CG_4_10_14_0_8_um_filter_38_16]|nr:MAG: lipoprotein-releasing system transmembrane subunit LolC [Gammaproteobacteria bacterium CG_4_10_14_0_8_um_filter_38_16]PJA02635.1 MAG: lipoprotein-releasing system transmembrane subunit LolC [Gammaproteobacteria bacterium CG_4_10_14_0_2_um_filter_38_22]PJB11091.1 MAG: lipoprotein-releasing system transmembrane subunit LolC [Gammaproteobacteria bacterium CG_4_9_14_3_um_filter_38_9]